MFVGQTVMDVELIRSWSARVLFAFVLVTIGFSLGRRTAPVPETTPHPGEADTEGRGRVVVYVAHMTFRCHECNQIEWFTTDLVNTEFTAELESGMLELITVDYMKNTSFAARYDISSSTVVVARFEDGEETGFERLDQVWAKVKNREEFMRYVRDAIIAELY